MVILMLVLPTGWTATEGVDGTGGIKLQNGQYSALETYGADVEPGMMLRVM